MNISMKQTQTHRNKEQIGGKGWGKDGLGVWDGRCKLVHIGWINIKVLLYSTGNYIQYPVINHNGEEYIYICMYK